MCHGLLIDIKIEIFRVTELAQSMREFSLDDDRTSSNQMSFPIFHHQDVVFATNVLKYASKSSREIVEPINLVKPAS